MWTLSKKENLHFTSYSFCISTLILVKVKITIFIIHVVNWMRIFPIQSHDENLLVKLEVPTHIPEVVTISLDQSKLFKRTTGVSYPVLQQQAFKNLVKSNMDLQWSVVKKHLLPMMICSSTNSRAGQVTVEALRHRTQNWRSRFCLDITSCEHIVRWHLIGFVHQCD